ncbi:non-ribosomal peptide synthetase [Herbidospora cretacea]|uniref:non-ribosomal peptide synthetase n=1 Tax=Herbidospora cretacea TaxID=28444 RepID=UPI0009EE6B6A|nr:non-ribosomal peptide synthetase [Herbidospora cretacea]
MRELRISYSTESSVDQAVVEIARRRPGDPAVTLGGRTLTYAELTARARAFADELTGLPPQRIGVTAHRTVTTVVQMLGAALAGHSFVLLNPDNPESTTAYIRESAGIALVADPLTGELTRDDRHTPSPAEGEAYVLHTSGSTGRPKGVSVSRANLAYANAARLTVHADHGEPVFLLLFPLHFDGAMTPIWGALTTGGHLVIADDAERRDPDAIADLVVRHSVTHTLTVPSFHGELVRVLADRPHTLKVAICAGEALTRGVIDQHFASLPEVALCNEYGPTECTIWATYRFYDRPHDPLIGRPIPGTTVDLLDGALRPVPDGEVGQIAISGPGVTAGYVGDPAQTAAVFVDGRYLTGDLARRTPDGELEFVGRLDNEVKMRGVRVNLETIEAAVASAPGVLAAAVTYDAATSVCCAFVTGDASAVRQTVTALLGPALVPDRVVAVATLPRTAHDKVDKDRLRVPGDAGPAERIALAWAEVLGVSAEQAVSGANFFALGGNSLSVLKLARTLSGLAGRRITAKELYLHATLGDQLVLLGGER